MADATIRFTSDVQKVLTAQQKVIASLQKTVGALRKVDRAGKKASKSVKGIGASALGAVAGFVSLGLAVAKVNQALEAQVQLRKSATERIETQEENLKRLIQISGGSKVKFDAFVATARGLVEQQGFKANEALGLVFQGASLGFTNAQILEMGQFKKFAKDILPLFQGVAGIQAVFGKGALGGTSESIISASLAAAEFSKVSVEQLLANVLKPGKSIRRLGGTAAEALAATAVTTITTTSPEVAATQVARLADVLSQQKRFRGVEPSKAQLQQLALLKQAEAATTPASKEENAKAIAELTEKLAGMMGKGFANALEQLAGMSTLKQEEIIGKKLRAQRAVDALVNNMALFGAVLASTEREAISGPGSLVQKSIRLAESVPVLRGLTAKQRAREAAKLTVEQVSGPRQLHRETVNAVTEQVLEEFNVNAITRELVRTNIAIRAKFDAAPLTRYFATLPDNERNRGRNAAMAARFDELLRELGLMVNPRTGELVPLAEETNVILRQILDKEPGGPATTGGPFLPPRMPPTAPPLGPAGPTGPDELGGDSDLGDIWAAANELMNRQGWTRLEKVRAWRAFRRDQGFEPDPARQGTFLDNPSDLAGEDRQSLRDMVAELGLVVDVLTQKLRKLSDDVENVTVVPEVLE